MRHETRSQSHISGLPTDRLGRRVRITSPEGDATFCFVDRSTRNGIAFALLAARTLLGGKTLTWVVAVLFGVYSLGNGYLLAVKYQLYDSHLKKSPEEIVQYHFYDDASPVLLRELGILRTQQKDKE